MKYEKITVPADGQRITINPDSSLNVPDKPLIAFVEEYRRRSGIDLAHPEDGGADGGDHS